MVLRLALFLILVVALIAVSVFGVSILNQSRHPATAAAPQTEQVLVAANLVSAGSLLQPGDIASGPVPVTAVPDGANLDTPANRSALIGAMVRSSISPGAPILDSAVIHPGDHGFLAAVLAPGMRATTVGVDAISGAAGLIWPGDHVDVLLTQTLDDPTVPIGQRIAASLVLTDVRVIATGQQLVQGAVNTGANATPPPSATTVTLEVSPGEAERCAVAARLGSLSLVVHSSETGPVSSQTPDQTAAGNQPVWADQVSPALTNVHGPDVVSTVHVYSGSTDSQDFKF